MATKKNAKTETKKSAKKAQSENVMTFAEMLESLQPDFGPAFNIAGNREEARQVYDKIKDALLGAYNDWKASAGLAETDTKSAGSAKKANGKAGKTAKAETAGSDKIEITISDYSAKSFAVFTSDKPSAEILKVLKSHNGRFNRNLGGKAGWIYPKGDGKAEKAIRKELKKYMTA